MCYHLISMYGVYVHPLEKGKLLPDSAKLLKYATRVVVVIEKIKFRPICKLEWMDDKAELSTRGQTTFQLVY